MTDATDTGSSQIDDLTRNSRPSFAVTPPGTGETPVLFVDGLLVPSTFNAPDNTISPIGSIAPGLHAITTGLQDTAGNISPQSPALNITITPVAALDPASDSGVLGDNITSDKTPSIQGFGTPGDTVTVTFPGGEVKTATITNPDGSWQVTPSNNLPEGPNAIGVVATNPAGDVTSSDTVNITIDSIPPDAPAITAIPENATGGTINTAEASDGTVVQVTIPANAQAGDILTLNIGGLQVPYTVLASDVGAIANVPVSAAALAQISDGTVPVSATLTDAAGNVSAPSAASSLTLDRSAPSAPSISSVPENASDINATEAGDGVVVNVSIPGDAKAGDTLTVTVNGTPTSIILSAIDIGNGSAPITIPAVALPASDGTYAVTAQITDAAGNPGAMSAPFDITLDRGLPTPPSSAPDMTDGTDSGSSTIDNNTSDTTPEFVIAAPSAGETPSLYVDGIKVPATFDALTNTLTPTSPLSAGAHTISYTLTDASGNESAQSPGLPVTIDTAAPSAPAAAPDMTTATDSGTNTSDDNTNDTTPTFTIVAPALGETPKLYVDGVLVPSTFDSLTNTLTPTNPIPDGAHSVTTTVTDAAGNESPQGPNLTINIDTTAPSAPSITTIPDNNGGGINGTEALDGVVVNVGLPGDAKAGDTLTVIVNGTSTSVVLTALDIGNGNAPVTIPVVSLPATDGTYPVTAKVTDAAGNAGTVSAPFDITLDRGLPVAPSALDLIAGSDSGVSSIDDNTSDNTPTITGAPVEPGATVTLYDSDGTTVLGTTIADGSGNWSITPSTPLADGIHNFTTKQTDSSGNTSPASTSLPVTIDTTAPSAPAAPDMTTATDSGTNTSDNNTNDNTPSFSVTPPAAGETPSLYIDGVKVPATFDSLTNTLTPTNPIPDGAYSITTTVTDAAGNESPQGPNLAINVDTTAPSAPSITTIPDNNGGGINGAEAGDGVIVNVGLPGDAKAGDTLTVIVNGTPTAVVLSALDISNGIAPVTIPVGSLPAADGTYPVTATLTDAAGNTSTPSAAFNITLDRGTPGAPGVLDLITSSDSGTNSGDNITNDTTPTISGAAVEPGATITLYDTDGTTVLGTTVADGSGNWSITPSVPLTDGLHSFTTKQTDISGNTSLASGPLDVTIDTGVPGTPSAPDLTASSDTGLSNSDDYTNETAPEFAVSVPASHTASLYVDGVKVPATLVGGVLAPDNPVGDGPHTITYTVTDPAGNESSQSPGLAITIDTVATAAPVINSIPENSGGGVTLVEQGDGTVIRVDIPGTAKVGDSLLLSINGQSVGYIIGAADIGGTANVPVLASVLTALGNTGIHPVSAQITDQAGNVSTASSSYPLVLTNAALTSPIVTAVPENNDGGIMLPKRAME